MIVAADQGPPPPAFLQALGEMTTSAITSGSVVTAGGLAPVGTGRRVEVRDEEVHVVDGPFAEAKEVVSGFALLEAASLEEAQAVAEAFMETHARHWPGWRGAVEVRQVVG